MDDSAGRARYRVFRKLILEVERRGQGRDISSDASRPAPTFAEGRHAIRAFRSHVADHVLELLETSPANEALVRQALCMDATVPLRPGTGFFATRVLPWFLLARPTIRHTYRVLSQSRCLEGRKYLFELLVKGSLTRRLIYYDKAIDFALTRLEEARTWEDLEALEHVDLDLLQVARELGITKPAEIRRDLLHGGYRCNSKLLWVLVSEGVIRAVPEFAWARHERSWWDSGETEEQLEKLRATVRCLMDHAVDREEVAGLLRHHLMGLRPERMAENIAHLKAAGVEDLSSVLSSTAELLWRSPTATWRFVTDVVGARSAAEIARFKGLLDCHDALSPDLVAEILGLGGGLDGLAVCQGVIAGLRPGKEDVDRALDRLRALVAPPHGLTIEQLAQCLRYLRDASELGDFLQVLVSYGMGDGASVLEFQRCFGKVSLQSLERSLSILGNRGRGQSAAEVAAWVEKAAQGGYFDGYEYLVNACNISDLPALRQAAKLVTLGVPFLQHLVEVRRMRNLKEIRRWYYDARGIDGYRSWTPHDAADFVLIDDAFARNQFSLLRTNQDAMRAIVRQRVENQIGPWPWQADEAAKSAYDQDREARSTRIRQDLLPMLRKVLKATGGLLLTTVFSGEGQEEEDLDKSLARLAPLLTDLMAGHGPVSEVLTPIEADAVALVYRLSVETVQARWREVGGREQDALRLRLRSHYPMAWRQVRWQLSRPLDRSGFAPLLAATRFAQGLADDSRRDMFTACTGLGPKQLRPGVDSTDLETLARHLGSLLAIAKRHEVVGQWMRQGFEELGVMDEDTMDAHQRIRELEDLFEVVLPDALDQHTEAFVQGLSEEDAEHWAQRLGPCSGSESGRGRLTEVLQLARDKVIPPYLAWARRQRSRYKQDGRGMADQALQACVSKHPAAFFAKAGAQLCTANNVEMWREERHLHLVVFDPVGRRMAGMALLYVQHIPELDRRHRSLVIRAINPTDEMLSGHAVASIVEAYFDVAIQIAQDNGLACVAFPPPSGMHLMSNRAGVETYVKERYVQRSARHSRAGHEADHVSLRDRPELVPARFYAYETGREPVEELHVVWRSDAPDGSESFS